MYFEFPRRSHFWGEAIFQKTLLDLTCKECSKLFSESGSLKTHLTLIQEKSDLLVKNVPNHFLRRSHSPVPCSLFHKRKSVVQFKDSNNSNLFSSSSFLALSFFVFKYVFKYVLIVEEMIGHDLTENIWKVVELSVSFSNSSCPTIVMTMLMIPSLVNITCNDFLS